ncbi:hypothetical protein KZ483_14365 [Paenibacillus sp. sptzw28]|uniref:hypothetical protein n=1 Tax=Paenibacillus sp. sptzw28 TaxID=715179 RepID=UPI001C6ED7A6|nr:hypothetical protein [Paenibacillus sp. sptzw28]QYR19152.1 hypothetical protein KZ483_14365 [Paenibacillus sp. sptzw28]
MSSKKTKKARFLMCFLIFIICCPLKEVLANAQTTTADISSTNNNANATAEQPPSQDGSTPDNSQVYPAGVLDKAKKLEKTVVREAVERRTENSKHYQLSDGSFIAEITWMIRENGNRSALSLSMKLI